MRNLINRKTAAVFLGAVLLAWSISSAFINTGSSSATALQLEEEALQAYDQSLVQQEGSVSTAFPAPQEGTSDPAPGSAYVPVNPFPEKLAPTHAPNNATPDASQSSGLSALDSQSGAFTVPETAATPRPTPEKKYIPDRIIISKIGLDAPIEQAQYRVLKVLDQHFIQWLAPSKFAAGWQTDSAPLGVPGNTVLNGHHNVFGEVFGKLVDLSIGDTIELYSGSKVFKYRIENKLLLREIDQPLSVRLENAAWLMPTDDERLTLVTCWPPEGNSYRIFVIALPISP